MAFSKIGSVVSDNYWSVTPDKFWLRTPDANRISENVRNSGVVHAENPNGHRLTVSIGIVNADVYSSQDTILDILKYADKALYHAKNSGKDDVFAYVKMPNSQHEFKRIDMIRDV